MVVSERDVAASAAKRLQKEGAEQEDNGTVDEHDEAECEVVATSDGRVHDIGRECESLHFLMCDDDVDDSSGSTSANTCDEPFLEPCQQDVVEHDIINEGYCYRHKEHHKECRGVSSGLKHILGKIAKVGGAEKFKNFSDKIHYCWF